MKRIGDGVKDLMRALGGEDETSRKAARGAEVNVAWRNAVKAVYKEAAPLILDHVNAVYIMEAGATVGGGRDGMPARRPPTSPAPSDATCSPAPAASRPYVGRGGRGAQLVVYSDDSLIRSDIDARQEFLKMRLREQGEHIDSFKILPSRFDMKARHPFARPDAGPSGVLRGDSCEGGEGEGFDPPSAERVRAVEERAEKVEDPAVRKALLEAIHADMKRKSNPNVKNNM